MSIGKIRKFQELETFPNVLRNHSFHHPELLDNHRRRRELKGDWRKVYFKNNNPIILELACGKGEYTVGLAQLFPKKNFIGVDLKGNRIWNGAKKAMELKLQNVAFIRTKIELLPYFFDENEVDEIWVIFPDPFPKKTSANRRLTSPFFLDKYRVFCKKDAIIHLKTDSSPLFEYTLSVIREQKCKLVEATEDIYTDGEISEVLAIQTYYENIHLEDGKTIKYLQFLLE